MSKISPRELCQRLKSEVAARQEEGEDNNLRLSILDYFISHNPYDDVFEKALKTRLDDPDPDKEQSKIICSQILEAWHSSTNVSP
jgi:hypothetical protein